MGGLARLLTWTTLLLGGVCALADSPTSFPPLRDRFDPSLQHELERTLAELGLNPAVQDGRLSVALVDLSDVQAPRVAAVNGDNMLYAASLPKIAILLGAFVEIERGEMRLDPRTRVSLTKMIRFSSNLEATRVLNRVGGLRLAEILQSKRFRLYDPLVNGGLWVGKAYGRSAAFRRDPLHNLSHGATAIQTARFYYLLETDRLIEPALCREMKRILSKSGINHKFVKGLREARPGAKMYRKSGSWRNWHSDSALVEAGRYKYIAVALTQHPDGTKWLTELIVPLHDLIVPTRFAALDK